MPRATGMTGIQTTSEQGHPTNTGDQGVAQGARIILARRLLLPRIGLPHTRRRAPVAVPRRACVAHPGALGAHCQALPHWGRSPRGWH
jgi:hypothetical protein